MPDKKSNKSAISPRKGISRPQQDFGKHNSGRNKRQDYREIYQNPYTQKMAQSTPRMDIRGQTPAKRRQAKEQKRINPGETEVRYGARSRQDYRIKKPKNKKKNRQIFLARLGLFTVIFFSIAFFAWLIFFVSLTSTSDEIPGRVWISVGLQNVEKTDDKRDDGVKYFRNGTMYVDMTFIAETYDMITTGDRDKLKFIFNENGEYATFCVDTAVVYVNGTPLSLDSRTISEDGKLYVPAAFFNEYVNELDITFEKDKNIINIIRDSERNDNGRYVGKMLTFSLKKDAGHSNIPEDSISEEVKASTYFTTQTSMGAGGSDPSTPTVPIT